MTGRQSVYRKLEECEKNLQITLDKNEELCQRIKSLEGGLVSKNYIGSNYRIKYERLVQELERLVKRHLTELQ